MGTVWHEFLSHLRLGFWDDVTLLVLLGLALWQRPPARLLYPSVALVVTGCLLCLVHGDSLLTQRRDFI